LLYPVELQALPSNYDRSIGKRGAAVNALCE
jgi:hypothetical protein